MKSSNSYLGQDSLPQDRIYSPNLVYLDLENTTMKEIYDKILELEGIPGYSKHQQLVQGIINAIDDKVVSKNDMLPSVNSMIKELGVARETVAKAYRELVSRGIVESKNRMGYYVATSDVNRPTQVALVLFNHGSLQEVFLKYFRAHLPAEIHFDTFFHHNKIENFENIIQSILGKYSMYIITPIPHPKTREILRLLPINKLLMIDRYEPIDGDFSHITQEFEQTTYRAFADLNDRIQRYDELIFFHHVASSTPIEIVKSFKRYLKDFKMKGSIRIEYISGSVEKGKAYFTLQNIELWTLIKDCKEKGLTIGKDVGIISHNDDLIKEIVCDGITTYSADFALLAQKAADFVVNSEKIKETIPTILKIRNSL